MKRFTFLLSIICGLAHAGEPQASAEAQKIDVLLASGWVEHNVTPNPHASDEVLVRRLHLDLVGRIPTYQETANFLADTGKDKRARLIDRLLASNGYTQHQFHYWADLLRVLSKGTYPGAAGRVTGLAYAEYIKSSVRNSKPYDQMVRELVSAQGKAWENGAIGYYQRDRGMPLDNIATATRIFLGTRIECAQCHNHPFDKWTQMQFHQMAAYTYGVQTVMGNYSPTFFGMLALQKQRREKNGTSIEDEVHLRQAFNEMIVPIKHAWVSHIPQTLRLPHDYQYKDAAPKSAVKAATLMGTAAPPGAAPMESFASWLTSPENPRFTTAIANRLWKKVFGLGLIEPVDDITDSTQAVNPALMEHLRKLMIAQRYDVKAFLRVLCNTKAYQREVTRTELAAGDAYYFTGPLLRRMSAEQIWDSFATLIHPTPDAPNLPVREEIETFLANARKLGEALENLPADELLKRADATSTIFKRNAVEFKSLQLQIAEARKRDDKVAVPVLAKQLGALRKTEIQTADQQIYIPAVMQLSDKSHQAGSSYTDIEVPGFVTPDYSKAKAAQNLSWVEEAKRNSIPDGQQAAYLKHRQTMMQLWPRAADLESPAPAGHALREFGQSDRDSVDNANHDASVPQALVLMNGQMMPSILHPWSQLSLAVKQAPYPDERLDRIWLTLLSRHPSGEERARWARAQEQGLGQEQDLIYSLLNTQQFIFIQ